MYTLVSSLELTKAKIRPSWTSKDLRDLLAMASVEDQEVAGITAVDILMRIDAITMPVADVVTTMAMVMVSKRADLESQECTDRAIGTANQSMTKKGAKLMNFAKKWIEQLQNNLRMPRRSRITPRKFV